MKISKATKIGILTAITLAIFIWGMNYLKGRNMFNPEDIYIARYSNIGGLKPSSDVILNGFKVGYAKNIYFAEDHSGDLIVEVAMTSDFPLPANSIAEIVSSDILGTRIMELIPGNSKELLQHGDTINARFMAGFKAQVSEQIAPVVIKAERMLASMDSAVNIISHIFSEDTREYLSNSFANISATTSNLKAITSNINTAGVEEYNIATTIKNLGVTVETLKNNTDKIDNAFTNISDFSDSLASIKLTNISKNLSLSLENLNQAVSKVENSEGTLGMLINDKQLYQNLNISSKNLNHLIVDFQENPKRYVQLSLINKKDKNNSKQHTNNKNVSFKILIMSTKEAVPLNSPIFEGFENIEEYKSGATYNYLTGNEEKLEQIMKLLPEAHETFPEASIIAFKKGRQIKLKKAIRISEK